ncbi:hypothetical protein V2A60_009044 [Cordyceps javanica]
MPARVLSAVVGLRRTLPIVAQRTSRLILPAGFVAGRRYASVDAATSESEPVAAGNSRKPSTKALAKQLEYINDPWVLGKYIEDLLAKDKFDDALTTVELASKKLDAVVSWNHLIDYLLKQQQIRRAMATYNNMKKRAQFPNAQTFTIMFRGLAKSQHPKNAVTEAIKLFNQLKNDRRLQPNTIHLNAVLSVCARAYDIDQLFLVAGELEDLGLAPTTATYGVIFNGMRQYMWREFNNLDKETKQANIEKMIGRSKNIWVEVLEKWQSGKLKLDEPLVCSMGRLLLLSKGRKEKLQVLDLIEQTMNIPNMVKKRAKSSSANSQESSELDMVASPRCKGGLVQPGQNTLALILTTLLMGRQTGAAAAYWNLLVHDKKLVPDNDNWLRMIGVLKSSKSSAQAAQILDTLPASGIEVEARSFAIAMEACVRDNINPHVMTHATRILHTMQGRLAPALDMHTMRLYLRVALVSHAAFRGRASTGDEMGAKAAYGRQIATALAELWHPYIDLYNRYFKSVTTADASIGDKRATGTLYNHQKEVIALGRMMVGAFSKVIEEKMLPGNNNRDMIIASAKINKGVTVFFADRELREPKLNTKATAARKREEDARRTQKNEDEGGEEKKSVFDIDMPELDDTVNDGANHKAQLRQGADFVWNTRKMSAKNADEKQRTSGQREGTSDELVIDRWISPSIGQNELAKQEDTHNDAFIPIKPVAEDTDANASGPGDGANLSETDSNNENDKSLWATLMARRN